MKYNTQLCTGYFLHDAGNSFDVLISTDSWDGVEDEDDERIFFYTDGEPLKKGLVVSEDFVLTNVQE